MQKIMNKLRRAAALLLCVCLLAAMLPASAFAEEDAVEYKEAVHISTVQELKNLAENCRLDSWSQNRTVLLDNDIDLTGSDFTGIPTFGGTFEGQRHTISGLTLTFDQSISGLFRYVQQGGMVRNLTVKGRAMPTGTRTKVGGVVGINAGTLQNCTFNGAVSAASVAGGIAGINESTGLINACQTAGIVYGTHFIGGIVGENHGVVSGCTNECNVNTTVEQNKVDLSDLTLEDLTGSEAATEITDIGGVAGISSGVLRACINRGIVGYEHIGYNVGGIAGSQTGYIEGCVNYTTIYGRKEVGGIVGQMEPNSQLQYSVDTLQTLQGQLDTLQGLMNKATNDAAAASDDVTTKLGNLQTQVTGARTAVDQLLVQVADGVSLSTKTVTTDLSKLFSTPEVQANGSSATPTPEPSAEPSPEPTETPLIPIPSELPIPSEIPIPSEVPIPSALPIPTALPETTSDAAPEEQPPAEQSTEGSQPEAQPESQSEAQPTEENENAHGRPARAHAQPVPSVGEGITLPTALPQSSAQPSASPYPEITPLPAFDELTAAQMLNSLANELPQSVDLEIPSVEVNNQDAITAARNDLSGNLTGIADGVTALNASGTGNAQALISDMRAITNQVNLIGNTLTGAANDLQNTDAADVVQDVSDEDTDEDTEGKVMNCINAGTIRGDLNVGGIAGAMAPENDLDPEEDVQVSGSESLNFVFKARVVLRESANRGTVIAKKQYAGGIVGQMELGTVRLCSDLGTIEADEAEYVGGIAGKSGGAIRQCYTKATLQGKNYIGGIAGSGTDISDCRTMVRIAVGDECLGAVAGTVEDGGSVTGNYFVGETLGGIDGVSYEGSAQPLDYADFINLENLPESFHSIFVRFVAEGATVASYEVNYGDKFPDASIPVVPEKEGCYGEWETFDGNHLTFDETVEAVYTPLYSVLESTQLRGDRAILLAEGDFSGGKDLFLTACAKTPLLAPGETLQEAWEVSMPADTADTHTMRYLTVADPADTVLYLRDGETWRKVETTVDGSYLVFAMQTGDSALCAAKKAPGQVPFLLEVGGGAIALLLVGLLLYRHHKKRKTKKQQVAKAAPKPEKTEPEKAEPEKTEPEKTEMTQS